MKENKTIYMTSDNYTITAEKIDNTFVYAVADLQGEKALGKTFDTAANAIRFAEDEFRSLV